MDDVIVLLERREYPEPLRRRLQLTGDGSNDAVGDVSAGVQFTFGKEWQRYSELLPEYGREFEEYFDLVDPDEFAHWRICDLGCGKGRWSRYLAAKCEELILVDFSEAIFVARRNLEGFESTLFFMGDLRTLPFRHDFCDLVVCLGVLHHLPDDALNVTRSLKSYSPRFLIYLYYALDNRPFYFRWLLTVVTGSRRILSRIQSDVFREIFTWLVAAAIYRPLVLLGRLLDPFGLASAVPLYDGYANKGFRRTRQDVYDRFFTPIEQRFSRSEILELRDSFRRVKISDSVPYWHFLLER